jgi:hypothetical protein
MDKVRLHEWRLLLSNDPVIALRAAAAAMPGNMNDNISNLAIQHQIAVEQLEEKKAISLFYGASQAVSTLSSSVAALASTSASQGVDEYAMLVQALSALPEFQSASSSSSSSSSMSSSVTPKVAHSEYHEWVVMLSKATHESFIKPLSYPQIQSLKQISEALLKQSVVDMFVRIMSILTMKHSQFGKYDLPAVIDQRREMLQEDLTIELLEAIEKTVCNNKTSCENSIWSSCDVVY